MSKEWWQDRIDDTNDFLGNVGKISKQVGNFLEGKISNYQSTINVLGIGVYDGLLAQKLQTNRTSTKSIQIPSQIVHSDEAVNDEFAGTNGVYYVNYANIYNTLNRNIGGSSYMNSGYDILDEGQELGQRSPIYFDASLRPQPTFISDAERDAYVNYIKYMTDFYGDLNYSEKSILAEKKGGYNVGVVRDFQISGSSNPNSDTDSLLGKMSSAILGNIITQRNIRRTERGFPSITNINYYDKGRLDIESSDGIESLDTAMGVSSSLNLPNFGMKSEYSLVEFGDFTVEYEYSARTRNYSLFDAWGELTNATISLSNSPAYNSMNKSVKFSFGDDSSTLYMSADKSLDISQFLIQNLKYKGGLQNSESFVTYFGKHNFDVYIDSTTNKSRYVIYTNGADDSTSQHVNFHYDEGAITEEYGTANAGTNFGSYLTYKNTSNFGKDLLNVTNNAFRDAKHRTIISKFYTNYGQGEKRDKTPFQSAITKRYGMSHGRNLLKVQPTNETGYDNPYCRVWTYHHQYSRLCDTIRPFTKRDGNDINCSFDDSTDVRQYVNEIAKHRNSMVKFTDNFDVKDRKAYHMVNSIGQKLLAENSVISKYNGLVNITPTRPQEEDKQVKTKNCMFSIENLAWKDIEKDGYNLSDEQIGPLGGRIMWFPPYGLTFNENVSANWNPVSFIGRGENMYTYTNTERSGSLSFIMLIDHPSLLNEWNEESGTTGDVDEIESTEQKILRFFAGCELLEPLTDSNDISTKSAPQEPEEEPNTDPHKGHFSFCVYFPNNYTGNLESDPEAAVSYLLNGIGYGLLTTVPYGTQEGDISSGEAAVVAEKGRELSLDYNILNYKYYDNLGDGTSTFNKEEVAKIVEKLRTNTEAKQDLISAFYDIISNSVSNEALSGATKEELAVNTDYYMLDGNEINVYIQERNALLDKHRLEQYVYDETQATQKEIEALHATYVDKFNRATTQKEKNDLTNQYNKDSKLLLEILDGEEKEAKEKYQNEIKPQYDKEECEFYIKYIQKIFNDNKESYISDVLALFTLDTFENDPTVLQDNYDTTTLTSLSNLTKYNASLISLSPQDDYYAIVDSEVLTEIMSAYEHKKDIKDYNIVNYFDTIAAIAADVHTKSSEENKVNLFESHFSTDDQILGGYEMSINPNYGISGKKFKDISTYDSIVKNKNITIATIGKYKSKFYEHKKFLTNGDDDSDVQTYSYFFPKHNKTDDYTHSWGYRVDEGSSNKYDPFNDYLSYNLDSSKGQEIYNSCVDTCSYGLNALGFYENKNKIIINHPDMEEDWENMYSFADVFAALQPDHANDASIKDCINKDKVEVIRKLVSYGIAKIKIDGVASVQGTTVGVNINTYLQNPESRNNQLSRNRGHMIEKWLKKQNGFKDLPEEAWPEHINIVPRGIPTASKDVSEFSMKNTRCAIVTIEYDESISIAAKDSQNQQFSTSGTDYSGYTVINQHSDDGKSDEAENTKYNEHVVVDDEGNTAIRYDNEETFFRTLDVNSPLLHHRIVDKVKYFDPAFHSITPEGFAARLTFLHQCTRQGNTVGSSDTMNGNNKQVTTATNLAFGRPPICVLRIGDFYNTKIIIESLSINYENGSGIQWDMNLEGIGMMPMFAKIDMNFKFIGGSDLNGPISRLQNAVSFNYYANTRVYDNRSDGVEYDSKGDVRKITPWQPYSNNKN